MKENPLLAMLAQLVGDISLRNNANPEEVFKLQQVAAASLIKDPNVLTSNLFQFEQLENFSPKHLDTNDMKHLDSVLKRVQDVPVLDPGIRVFRRETPFLSSQVLGSIPIWARGGKIVETIGPVITNDGRKVWFDLYRTIPLVQVWMQGAAQPFMLLPLEVNNLVSITGPKKYKIPKGSVWMQADKFATSSPDNLYCGLTVSSGEINLTGPVAISNDNKLVIPNGIEAAFTLNLEQKVVTDVSPDNNGIDVKDSKIELPKTLNFTINNTGQSLTLPNASWKLYGQSINFTYNNTKPAIWNTELNRINIFYKAGVTDFEVSLCKSPVCKVSGKAAVVDAAWALTAAVININAPLQADGTGAMLIVVKGGIEATWPGLKDANLFEASSAQLKGALIMLMPGRLNIATPAASNPTGKQRYDLWQEVVDGVAKPMQYIDLLYTKKFNFFYDSMQSGVESVMVRPIASAA